MKKIFTLAFALFTLTTTHATEQLDSLSIGNYTELLEDGDGTENVYDGSYYDWAPTTFYLKHTGTQIIYTADQLQSMAQKDITALKFIYFNAEAYQAYPRTVKVYFTESDASAFEYSTEDRAYHFFRVDLQTPTATYEFNDEMGEHYSENAELIIPITTAYTYSGKNNLIVTLTFDGEETTNGSLAVPFYRTDIRKRAMTFTSDRLSYAEYTETDDWPKASATLNCGTDIELPVTQFVYKTKSASALPYITITNPQNEAQRYDLMGRPVDRSYKGLVISEDGKKFIQR